MNLRDYTFLALCLCSCLSACSEAADPAVGPTRSAAPATPAEAHKLSSSALVDRQGDNWLVIGGPNLDLVGADGEPDVPAGRYINNGKGVAAGAIGPDGWLVGGADGVTVTLDADGKPIRGDVRTAIGGGQIGFIAAGKDYNAVGELLDVFLVGGEDGKLQISDSTGEPFEAKQAAAGAVMLTAGVYIEGQSQWLMGAQDGVLYSMGANLSPSPQGSPVGANPIVAVFANPDANANAKALVLGGGSASYYPDPSPVSLGAGVQISAAAQVGDQIIIGLQDGRVGAISFNNLAAPAQWVTVFNAKPVTLIAHNGTSLFAFDDAGHGVALNAQLSPQGSPVALGDGGAVRAARWSQDRWLLATSSSLILEVGADLQLLSQPTTPLDGREIRAAAAGTPGVLLVGDAGRARLVGKLGQPDGQVQTVAGEPTLRAVGFSGKNWLVAGDGGAAQLVGLDGALQGSKLTLLGGREIRALAWSGTNWLAVGAEGYIQRVRDDGTTAGEPTQIASLDEIYGARWSGSEWMLVGSKGGRAAFQLVNSNANLRGDPGKIDRIQGPFYAAEWNGREWLIGGHGGNVQLVGSDGQPRTMPDPQPRDVLGGQDVLTIDYNNDTYLVGGRRGFVRQVRDNLLTSRPPVSVAAFKDVRAVVWTSPRGFAGGLCLTPTSCYAGPCLGTFKEGFCCDRACDRPCEACTQDKTGQADGTCAPIIEGELPATAGACAREAEASCGNTGVCDGAGECQLHGPEISCQAAACSGGQVTPAGSCDGSGMCAVGAASSCAPYAGCDGASCAVSCLSSNDCVEGYVCQGGSCIMEVEQPPAPPKKDDDDGGCATSGAASPAGSGWLLALAGLLATLRRRRA